MKVGREDGEGRKPGKRKKVGIWTPQECFAAQLLRLRFRGLAHRTVKMSQLIMFLCNK